MWRQILIAGLLAVAACSQASSGESKDEEESNPAKRSPISASAIYGAAAPPRGQFIVRHGDDAQELAPEYLGLLQQYLEAQQQQQQQQQHHHLQQQQQQQHQQHQQQPQHVPRARLGALIEQELTHLAERPAHLQHKLPQEIPLDVEQYHVETSPRRPVQQQLYYPVEEQPQPQHQPQPQPQPQPQAHAHLHRVQPAPQPQPADPQPQQHLRYHQAVPIQYGYEDEQQIHQQQQNPQAIVRAQAQAEAQALAFQKIAQASHYKHQDAALEQIRIANEKHRQQSALEQIRIANEKQRQQSALEQIRQGEAVSEAGREERVRPKDPESAYKARIKAQATALVAEQRRAHEAAEYKAHADAILKLQAQQRAHLRAQEEAHHYALNYEKNQQRAQAQAQAIANAQALALYKAHQQARAKAQSEAKQAARAQAEARRVDPDSAPVIQYLLPNKVPLPAPEVYLPKAAEALRAEAAQKRLKKPQHIKHLLLEEVEPQLLQRGPKPDEQQQQQQLAFLVDAGYYRKQPQPQPQQHRPLLRQSEYQGLEDVEPPQHHHPHQHYQQYQQQIEGDKLALLVPVEQQSP